MASIVPPPPPPPPAIGKWREEDEDVPTAVVVEDDERRPSGHDGRRMFMTALSAGQEDMLPVTLVMPPHYNNGTNSIAAAYDRYDALSQLVSNDGGNAQTMKTQLESMLTTYQTQLHYIMEELKRNRTDQPYLAKRINRNEHPHFFHYMQFDRLGKVARLKGEMESLVSTEQSLLVKEQSLQNEIQRISRQLPVHTANSQIVEQARAEMTQLYNYIIQSKSSPQLTQLVNQQRQAVANLNVEVALEQQLTTTESHITQAQQMLWSATNNLNVAAQDNQMAQNINYVDMMDGFGRRNDDFFERTVQFDRDRNINQAQQLAYQASDALRRAVATLPQEARVRYPEITREMVSIPVPDIRGASYGNDMLTGMFGPMGDMFNDMSATGKIQQNLQGLALSQQVATQHLNLVRELERRVREHVTNFQSSVNGLSNAIEMEKSQIFARGR